MSWIVSSDSMLRCRPVGVTFTPELALGQIIRVRVGVAMG